jgi:penicillin-binding protein 1C
MRNDLSIQGFFYLSWGSSIILLVIIYAVFRFSAYPELDIFKNHKYSLELFDRYGVLVKVTALEDGLRRIYKDLDSIPDKVEEIFILSEDSRFYFHPGVDILAVIRAYSQNRSAGRIVSGASTISMQLARIISGTDHGYRSKIIEIFNAFRLESRLSKKEILELWLNNIPFSFQTEGISAASLKFLGKDISLLETEAALLLAVIPRSPATLNPLRFRDASINAAVELALNSSILTIHKPTEYSDIVNSFQLVLDETKKFYWPDITPHFSLYTEKMVHVSDQKFSGKITTSIDSNLNNILEDRINYYLSLSESSRITTGAGLVISNNTGEILAYVGSANFYDTINSGQIDGVQILNQPGSTLKPFLYALAIERGFLPSSVLPDISQHFGETNVYQPMNFDNTFHGPVLLRIALASSMNVPAVYIINRLGVLNFADYLIALGFESLRSQRDIVGSGLALGNAEVSLMELTRAFSVFSRGGIFLPLTPFAKQSENTFLQKTTSGENVLVMKPYTAGIIRDILSDDNSRFPGFGENSIMETNFEAMFKTGTSNQFQNIWALGASPEYTVGIWMGDFSGNTVIGRTGSSLPAAIAVEMLELIHTDGVEFSDVPESEEVRLCTLSGLIPTDYTPSTYVEYLPVDANIETSNWHIPDPLNPDSTILTVYPEEYSSWLATKNRSGSFASGSKNPEIIYPPNNSVFFIDPTVPVTDQTLKIETIGFFGETTSVIINGTMAAETNNGIYNFQLIKGEWEIEFVNETDRRRIIITVK